MEKKKNRTLVAISSLIAGLAVFGCAPPAAMSPVSDRMNTLKIAFGMSSSNDSAEGSEWICPLTPNVRLFGGIGNDGYPDGSGNGDFTVCVNRTDSSKFRIKGMTNSASLCFFPTTQINPWTLEGNVHQSAVIGSSPIDIKFESKSVTLMKIADCKFTTQMMSCMSGPNVIPRPDCPPHSEGPVQ